MKISLAHTKDNLNKIEIGLEVKGIGRTPTMDEVQVRTLLLNFFISVAEPLVEEKYENDE